MQWNIPHKFARNITRNCPRIQLFNRCTQKLSLFEPHKKARKICEKEFCKQVLLQTFEGVSPGGIHILFPPATMHLTEVIEVINTQKQYK